LIEFVEFIELVELIVDRSLSIGKGSVPKTNGIGLRVEDNG
jgi:hypothetical protein